MPLSRKFNRPPADFHPDFGYLSPSGRRRSTVRVALAAATFGLVSGAVGATVLLPRIGRDLRIEHAFSAVQSEPSTVGLVIPLPAAEQTPVIDGSAGQSLPAAASGRKQTPAKVSPPPARADAGKRPASAAVDADKPCKEETWPYFDSKCLWGGARKDAGATTTPAQPAPVVAPAPVTADVGAAATSQPEQRPAVAKKKPKSTSTAARSRREELDPRTAYVNPNGGPHGGGPFGNPYGGPWRGGWGGWGW